MSIPLSTLNELTPDAFVLTVGPVFEHSPWIAERAAASRPFESPEGLRDALCEVVRRASAEEQLGLIRAHPDLVGKAVLTAESQGEQAAAGLGALSAEEVAQFNEYNQRYKARFGFPFVICARLNKKDAILQAFPRRLGNSVETERATALAEIEKIAALRLADLVIQG